MEKARNGVMITIAIAIVAIVTLWIWKAIQLKHAKQESEQKQIELKARANKLLDENYRSNLALLAKPLVWAIRSEMLRGNMEQANLYLNDFVKEKNFQRIAIIDETGKIISSTDKKDEGRPANVITKTQPLATDSVLITSVDSTTLAMSSPIMGLNKKLGALFLTYRVPKTNL